MAEKQSKTLEEKVDHLLSRMHALESHFINNNIKLQELHTPDPEVHDLIVRLNTYTNHIQKVHAGAASAYESIRELVNSFRRECEPYGEIKFLNKKLYEIQEVLKKIQKDYQSVKNPEGTLSWIEDLNLEIKNRQPRISAGIDAQEEARYSKCKIFNESLKKIKKETNPLKKKSNSVTKRKR